MLENKLLISRVKRVSGDMILNIIASSIPLFLLQFLIQPYVAKIIGSESYGSMLTIIGFLNIGMGVFGNSINNARLIDTRLYETQKGDFNLFLVLFNLVNGLLLVLIIKAYKFPLDNTGFALILISSFFTISSSYLSVEYRIQLHYKKIMFSRLIQAFGFALGSFLFFLTKKWEWIFFLGYGFEFLYVVSSTRLLKEPYRFTNNIKRVFSRITILVASSLLGSLLAYYDRLLIFPLFGGTELAIYYAATIVGKTLSLVTSPLSSVLLSYSTRLLSISRKHFLLFSLALLLTCIMGYFVCIQLSEPLIRLLYPEYLEAARKYISITVAASMFEVYYSFVWPIIFRFGKNHYPLLISGIKAVFYLFFSILLVNKYGVFGVCFSSLSGSMIQAFVVLFLGFHLAEPQTKLA